MKKPIKWHEDCLYNMKYSLEQKRKRYEELTKEINGLNEQIELYNKQINIAKNEMGKDGFDRDKFMVKRSK